MTTRPLEIAITALLAGAAVAQDEAAARNWRELRTTDGTRFVVLATGGVPLIHWVTASPAGDLLDPVEWPGLSFAVTRASLSGTDTVGTTDAREEQHLREAIERAERRIHDLEARGEPVPEELSAELVKAERGLAALQDPEAWRRAVRAAPAGDIELEELAEAVLLSVATVPEGFATLARLLMDRRENAVLRTLEEDYRAVTEARAATREAPSARLRAEVRDLAFSGLGPRPPAAGGTRIDRERALALHQRMQNPAATLHVIVGGFDLDDMVGFLERQFSVTQLESIEPPLPVPRRESRERVSTIAGVGHEAAAVAFAIDPAVDPRELIVLAEWFAGGQDSYLAEQLRAGGFGDAEVRYEVPFPLTARPGLLLVEVRRRATTPHGELDLVGSVRAAITSSAELMRWADLGRARRRTRWVGFVESSDPAAVARTLAVECGIRGRPVDAILDSTQIEIDWQRFRDLARSALAEADRCLVHMEGPR